MDQRISFFTLGVDNLEAMRDFYKNVFGWTTEKDEDGIVFFRMNGFILGLFPMHELAEDVGIMNDHSGFKGCTLAMNFRSEAEVDSCYKELVSKGAKAIRHPEKVFWGGYRGYLADIENNYWELAYNPFLELDDASDAVHHG